ncbi:YbaY family lipoprotein [Cernens ardua]|uniref:YbaY family lipoprotein n=1 Tax=Cernens ardua TaxID=3402176 RepID=UPI003F987209
MTSTFSRLFQTFGLQRFGIHRLRHHALSGLMMLVLMTGISALWAPVASAIVVSSQGAVSPNFMYSFSGYVVSESRMWVPVGSHLRVDLVDTTDPAHQVVVASSASSLRRAVPMPFHLNYHPTRIIRTHHYGLTATVTSPRGARLWQTASPQAVSFDQRLQVLGSPFVLGVTRG